MNIKYSKKKVLAVAEKAEIEGFSKKKVYTRLAEIDIMICKLDFDKMLKLNSFDFYKEINGILSFIDEDNNCFINNFCPKCILKRKEVN